jgi:hypothetical protein
MNIPRTIANFKFMKFEIAPAHTEDPAIFANCFEIAPASTEIFANWYDAKLYCQFLNIDGKTDWRLPYGWELDHMRNEVHHVNYWTIMEEGNITAKYRNFYFKVGLSSGSKSIECFVRAVRTI